MVRPHAPDGAPTVDAARIGRGAVLERRAAAFKLWLVDDEIEIRMFQASPTMLHAVVLAMQATKAAVAAIEPFVASLGCSSWTSRACGNGKAHFLHFGCICVCVTNRFFVAARRPEAFRIHRAPNGLIAFLGVSGVFGAG